MAESISIKVGPHVVDFLGGDGAINGIGGTIGLLIGSAIFAEVCIFGVTRLAKRLFRSIKNRRRRHR